MVRAMPFWPKLVGRCAAGDYHPADEPDSGSRDTDSDSLATSLQRELEVSDTGTPPLSYQWQFQGTNLVWTNLVNGGTNLIR